MQFYIFEFICIYIVAVCSDQMINSLFSTIFGTIKVRQCINTFLFSKQIKFLLARYRSSESLKNNLHTMVTTPITLVFIDFYSRYIWNFNCPFKKIDQKQLSSCWPSKKYLWTEIRKKELKLTREITSTFKDNFILFFFKYKIYFQFQKSYINIVLFNTYCPKVFQKNKFYK